MHSIKATIFKRCYFIDDIEAYLGSLQSLQYGAL